MRSIRSGGKAATLFTALTFALTPTAVYAADGEPSSAATVTADTVSVADQLDAVDTSADESTDESSGNSDFASSFGSTRGYCSHDGFTATGDPRQRCTKLDNGTLYHLKNTLDTETRAYTSYVKTGGGSVSIRLGYSYSGTEHWSGFFTVKSGDAKQRSWHFGERNRDCKSTIGLLQQKNKDKVQTPIAKC